MQFVSWAGNEQERIISKYLGNEKSRMTFEAGKGRGEVTIRKYMGSANEPNYSEIY